MIVVYEPEERIQNLVVKHMIEGLVLHGEEVAVLSINDEPATCDVSVVFGFGTAKHRAIINLMEDCGGRVLVLDYGAVSRPFYWTAGWDGLMGNADFMNVGSPGNRWMSMNIQMHPWKNAGSDILLAGQVPWDGSVSNVNIIEWLYATTDELKSITDRPIVLRPHPLAVNKTPHVPGTHWSTSSLDEDLRRAWCVVTWNSTTSGMSVIKGVPVYAMDRGCIAWEVANHCLADIERPIHMDRTQWAYNLGYSQWTLEDLRRGVTWSHLKGGARHVE